MINIEDYTDYTSTGLLACDSGPGYDIELNVCVVCKSRHVTFEVRARIQQQDKGGVFTLIEEAVDHYNGLCKEARALPIAVRTSRKAYGVPRIGSAQEGGK